MLVIIDHYSGLWCHRLPFAKYKNPQQQQRPHDLNNKSMKPPVHVRWDKDKGFNDEWRQSDAVEWLSRRMSSLTLRVVWENEEVDAGGPGPGAEDGDSLRISAEVADVLVEPAQRLDLVQQAVVSFGGLIAGAEETWAHRFQLVKMCHDKSSKG